MKKQLKVNTLKNQAWTNLICGVITIPLYSVMLFPNMPHRKTLVDVLILIAAVIGVVLFIRSSGKKELADELSRANMHKADSVVVNIDPIIIVAVGIFMHLRGNYHHVETFGISGDNIALFGIILMNINGIVKNSVFLWLDRTPKADYEEE
ncbi:MAG: hypothetical protein K5979_10915 [Ruminococcus sp.]|nr:hypothetical protein [Ruminococcus sp.]